MTIRDRDFGAGQARGRALLPFDQPQYAEALGYLGQPMVVDGRPIVFRKIPGTDATDAFGPFPYGSPPEDLERFLSTLSETGVVSWTCVMRPGTDIAAIAALDPVATKEHFVFFRDGSPLNHSARTRRHIRRSAASWTIALRPIADAADTAMRLHQLLEARTPLSRVARVDRRHFESLAGVPGFHCAIASTGGRESAFLIFAESDNEIHFHLTAGDEEALRSDGMYALFDYMIKTYAPTHDLYFGGTPAGANGEGVGRFKARFANRRLTTSMARVILDAQLCEELITRLGRHRWFPPYRDPMVDQGLGPPKIPPSAERDTP